VIVRTMSVVQVRDAVLRKQTALVASLKAFAAARPRAMLAATSARFVEIERALRVKPTTLEDVEAQRKLVADLPAKVAALQSEVDAARVSEVSDACNVLGCTGLPQETQLFGAAGRTAA